MITKNLRTIKEAVELRFADAFDRGDLYQLGVYNRRRIRPCRRGRLCPWSQHAWGNAWDIGVRKKAVGDAVVDWLKAEKKAGRLPVRLWLWQRKGHWNHIHVEAKPKMRGTPPPPPGHEKDEEAEMREMVMALQRALNAAGFRDHEGKVLVVDGIVGPRTEAALLKMARAARDSLHRGDKVTLT